MQITSVTVRGSIVSFHVLTDEAHPVGLSETATLTYNGNVVASVTARTLSYSIGDSKNADVYAKVFDEALIAMLDLGHVTGLDVSYEHGDWGLISDLTLAI